MTSFTGAPIRRPTRGLRPMTSTFPVSLVLTPPAPVAVGKIDARANQLAVGGLPIQGVRHRRVRGRK